MKSGFFKKSKILMLFGLSMSLAPITSCSAFFGGDEFTITDTSVTTDEETGDTIVTITFSGDDVEPLTFRIPSVINGKDGVGISNITSELQDGQVVLTISYTDETLQDTVISVPVINGENGIGITGVIVGEDDNGNTTFQFTYSDNSTSEVFTLPKGKDGVGIENIEQIDNGDGTYTITITFTDDSIETKTFTIRDGVSIESVEYSPEYSDDKNYALIITFSDESVSLITLPRPTTNKWLSGVTDPKNTDGNDGDYYLNEYNGNVFVKRNGTWNYLFSMKGTGSSETKEYYNVIFELRDDEYTESLTPGSRLMISVEEGETVPLAQIPVPTKNGYTFNGWYAGEEVNPNVGHFTNLTPVTSDLTLYATWLEN